MHTTLRLTALLLLVTAKPAFAQEGGLLDLNPGLMIWTFIIFLLVLVILYKAAYPHILGAVEAREAKITELLASAARDREEAQTALAQQTKDLDATRSRIQELVAEGKSTGERVRDEILADARRQAEELLARARRDVRQELEAAVEALRVEAVDIALAAASKLVDRNLDQEDNRRLVREYLADIGDSRSVTSRAGV